MVKGMRKYFLNPQMFTPVNLSTSTVRPVVTTYYQEYYVLLILPYIGILEWTNLVNRMPFAIFIASFIYTRSSFINILPSNWFRLSHLPIFCPSKIFLCGTLIIVSIIFQCVYYPLLLSAYNLSIGTFIGVMCWCLPAQMPLCSLSSMGIHTKSKVMV